MRSPLRVLSSAALLFVLSAAEPARAEGSYTALMPQLATVKLNNGLRIVFAQNQRSTFVTIGVVHALGIADEPRRGVWDLLMRLAWTWAGTKRMPTAEIERALSEDGMRTNFDHTQDSVATFVDAPSSHLARAIWASSEPMASLFDGMNEATYQRAVKFIVDSRNQEDEHESVFENRDAHVWPNGHPYHRDARAADEEIATLTLAEARRIHRACMVPNGTTVIVSGNFDRTRAEDAVRKYFGPIPSSGVERPCQKPRPLTGPPSRAVQLVFESGAPSALAGFAWSTPAQYETDDAALDVAAEAIRDRIDDALVDSLHVASSVRAQQISYTAGSMFWLGVAPAGTERAGGSRIAMNEFISLILRDGLSNEEVATARRKLLARAVDVADPHAFASRIAHAVVVDYGLEKLARDPDRYAKLDTAAVMAAARKYLVPERRVTVVVETKSGAPIQGRLVGGGAQ